MYIPKLFLDVLQWPGNETSTTIYIVLTVKFRLDLVQSDAAEKIRKKSKYNNNNNFLFIQLTHNPETH